MNFNDNGRSISDQHTISMVEHTKFMQWKGTKSIYLIIFWFSDCWNQPFWRSPTNASCFSQGLKYLPLNIFFRIWRNERHSKSIRYQSVGGSRSNGPDINQEATGRTSAKKESEWVTGYWLLTGDCWLLFCLLFTVITHVMFAACLCCLLLRDFCG